MEMEQRERYVKPEWKPSPSPPVVEMDCSPFLQPEVKVIASIQVLHHSLALSLSHTHMQLFCNHICRRLTFCAN